VIGLDDGILIFTMVICLGTIYLQARDIYRAHGDRHNWLRMITIFGAAWAIGTCGNALSRTLNDPTDAMGMVASLLPFMVALTIIGAHSIDKW
jgi:hypothetical protein